MIFFVYKTILVPIFFLCAAKIPPSFTVRRDFLIFETISLFVSIRITW